MFGELFFVITIYGSVALALLWSLFNTYKISQIKVGESNSKKPEDETLIEDSKINKIKSIGEKISQGANAFLFQEYIVMTMFIVVFSVIVFLIVDLFGTDSKGVKFYATVAFIIGAFTSMLCGYIGMRIAVYSNYRTTYKAIHSLEEAFKCAYRAGTVMGFTSVGIGLGVLLSLILVYIKINQPKYTVESMGLLMELLAGYGLGGSSMALFGRVGGGIYTKAADVGADLVGKVEEGLEEDSPRNPATIADNVGDNVGDIAGMGSDLFGSFAEASCATLVIIANNKDLVASQTALFLPLMVTAMGIIACFFTSFFGIYIYKVNKFTKIQTSLNLQLLISTVLTCGAVLVALVSLPAKFKNEETNQENSRW